MPRVVARTEAAGRRPEQNFRIAVLWSKRSFECGRLFELLRRELAAQGLYCFHESFGTSSAFGRVVGNTASVPERFDLRAFGSLPGVRASRVRRRCQYRKQSIGEIAPGIELR